MGDENRDPENWLLILIMLFLLVMAIFFILNILKNRRLSFPSKKSEKEDQKTLPPPKEEQDKELVPPSAESLPNEEEEEEQGTDNSDSSDSANILLGLKKTVNVPNETREQKSTRQAREAQEAIDQQARLQKIAAEELQQKNNYYNICYNNGNRQSINGVSDVAGFQLDPNWINTAMGQINGDIRGGLRDNLGGDREIKNQLQMVYNDITTNGFIHAMNLYGGHDFRTNSFLAHETYLRDNIDYREVYLYRTDVNGGAPRPGSFGRFIVGIVNDNIVCIYFIWHTGQGFTYIRIF